MYFFNAVKKQNTIEIASNTHWYCNVLGNFMLSKNKGSGNDIIEIIIPRELSYANGTVIFTYGDERCYFPEIQIYILNDCYIKTIPEFQKCGNENVLIIPYDKTYEVKKITILSNGLWHVVEKNSCDFLTKGDELMIYATSYINPYVKVIPNVDCSNVITIKMKNNGVD